MAGTAAMKRHGFTLIELLLVVGIIGLLAAVAVPGWQAQRDRSQRTDARAWLIRLGNDQQAYFVRHGQYATDLRGLGFDTATAATPGGHYRLSVSATTATGFTLRATRIASDREANRCAWYTLDESQRRSSGPAAVSECWWR
ncbi:MAG: type IV pilin protein [Pseudomonadota bacterium]